MPPTDRVRLQHLLDALTEATSLVQARSRADLEADHVLCLALTRLLEIIGEAARGLSANTRNHHPQVPWAKMIGMRDRLVHGYYDINLDIVWQTITTDLPTVEPLIQAILNSHP